MEESENEGGGVNRDLRADTAVGKDSTPLLRKVDSLELSVRSEFPEASDDDCRMLSCVKFLTREATISGYVLKLEDKLTLFTLLCGMDWRAHEGQLFHYTNGYWERRDGSLVFDASPQLIGIEGCFVSLSEEDVEWS